MEQLKDFVIQEIIQQTSETVIIGRIHAEHAIYILPRQFPAPNELASISLGADNSLRVSQLVQPRLIYPASPEHLRKYTQKRQYVKETYSDYGADDKTLKMTWMDNLIEKIRELEHAGQYNLVTDNAGTITSNTIFNERIYLSTADYFIIKDYKWDGKSAEQLYLLLVFRDDMLRSIRDVSDVGLLERARRDILNCCKAFGLGEKDVCLFFHYRPSFFRLHIHILCIVKSTEQIGSPFRSVYLDDVIRNLKLDIEYYKRDMHLIR